MQNNIKKILFIIIGALFLYGAFSFFKSSSKTTTEEVVKKEVIKIIKKEEELKINFNNKSNTSTSPPVLTSLEQTFTSCKENPSDKKTLQVLNENEFTKSLSLNKNTSKEEWRVFSYMKDGKEHRVRIEDNLNFDKPHIKLTQYSVHEDGYPIIEGDESVYEHKTIDEVLYEKDLSGQKRTSITKNISFDDEYSGLKGSFLSINGKIQELTVTNDENKVLSCQTSSCLCM